MTVSLPASWAFSGNLISIAAPSSELIAAGMLNVAIEAIGFDQSFQSASLSNPDASSISNEVFLGGSAAEFLSALDYGGPVVELSLTDAINVGSIGGLLNLSSASVTDLNPMSLKIDNASLTSAAIVPSNNRLEIRIDRADLAKPVAAMPVSTVSDDVDQFADWVVKPGSMSSFASAATTDSIISDGLASPTVSASLMGLADPAISLAPVSIDLLADQRVATLAGE